MNSPIVSDIRVEENTNLDLLYEKISRAQSEYVVFSKFPKPLEEEKKFLQKLFKNLNVGICLKTNDLALLEGISIPLVVLIPLEQTSLDLIKRILNLGHRTYLRCNPSSVGECYSYINFIKENFKDLKGCNYFIKFNKCRDRCFLLKQIRELPNFIQEKICVDGTALCFIKKEDIFHIDTSSILDIKNIISEEDIQEISLSNRIKMLCKSKECKECINTNHCFGQFINGELEFVKSAEYINKKFESVIHFFKEHPCVDIQTIEFDGHNPDSLTVEDSNILQNVRINKSFKGYNFYHIFSFKHSMYFNRKTEPCQIFDKDPRGLPSMNMQFIGLDIPELQYKLKQDLLLPNHGLAILSKVKLDPLWSQEKQTTLDNFTFEAIKDIILKNGGNRRSLIQKKNDLFYNGKKFAGQEWKFIPNYGYIENTVLTCDYEKEKTWFEQLYHYDGEHEITGITNEVPSVTKELLIENLYRRALEFFK